MSSQFLLGSDVLVAPVFRSIGVTSAILRVYFPPGGWFV